MQLLREGDTLKITRLDRLSRSMLHLVTLGAELRGRGIGLQVVEQGIDTSTMEGRPAALQRPREDRPADRQPVRRAPVNGVRTPRPQQDRTSPTEEDSGQEALTTSTLRRAGAAARRCSRRSATPRAG
jgi:hypothetical protein